MKYSEGDKSWVCRTILCGTLLISYILFDVSIWYISESEIYMGQYKSKGRKASNSIKASSDNLVRAFIGSFPRVESHYCWKEKNHYLSCDLNITTIYRLYKNEFCTTEQIQPVSLIIYRKIFLDNDPDLSFVKPKKDQCAMCNTYSLNIETLENVYNQHKQKKLIPC